MVGVDTSFLVRLLTGEPAAQAKEAQAVYDRAGNRELAVDRVILAECLYVLRSNYRFSKPESLELLGDLLKSKTFVFIDEDICNLMLGILKTSNLSPEDACLAALVALGKAESVATFDGGLLKYLTKQS